MGPKTQPNKIEEIGTIKELGTAQLPPMPQEAPLQVINIIGEIEGHMMLSPQSKSTKYEHMIPLLTGMEQDDRVKGILFIINTIGGDVEAGLALSELISSMSKPTVSLVIGGGHSIGVPLAVSSDYSFIAKTATMMIHPIRSSGLFINVPQSYIYYNKMQDRVIGFVCEHADISEETFRGLMMNKDQLADDTGTVLIGKDAVSCGLINQVGGLNDAFIKLKDLTGISEP